MTERAARITTTKPSCPSTPGILLQRKCSCGAHTNGASTCDECRNKRAQRASRGSVKSTARVQDVLGEAGQSLAGGARDYFESRFGHDFSGVRLHTGPSAEGSAAELGARAYTVGEHIVFAHGQYDPYSRSGRLLLAHELTHVLQQRSELRRSPATSETVDVSHAPAALRRQPFPGVIGRCREQGVPCPAPYAHHGSICRLMDCYSAATSRLPGAVSPGVCVYRCIDGKTCACVLVGTRTAAVCTFTFCDEPGQASAEPDTQSIAERALAMARQQGGNEGDATGAGSDRQVPPSAQAMLEVGPVDDPFEREADHVASWVVGMADRRSSARAASVAGPIAVHPGPAVAQRQPDGVLGREQGRIGSHGGTLPYREATELQTCLRIMGDANTDYCRQQVLGETPEAPPRFTHVPGITSPQPRGTQAGPGGSTHFTVGNVEVTFQPDDASTDPALAGRAETHIQITWGGIHYVTDGRGRIASFTGPGTAQASVRTSYGAGTSATSTSGYGRGTTAGDRASGDTSLGFHEGQHGVDYQDYLAAHPFPTFQGAIGMTEAAFTAAMTRFTAAATRYGTAINDYSAQQTDCAGFSIDQFNAAAAAAGGTARAAMCRTTRRRGAAP